MQGVGKAHFIYYNYMGLFFHLKLISSQPNSAVICRVGYLSYPLWLKKKATKFLFLSLILSAYVRMVLDMSTD